MIFHEDIQDIIIELIADIQDIGDEKIWAFYKEVDNKKTYTDYRYKNTPNDPLPKTSGKEKVEEMFAKELLFNLKKQKAEELH